MEQNLNCYSVAWFGAGIRISKYEVTSQNLQEAIQTLATNTTYKRKAEDLSILLQAGGGAARGAQLIESVALVGNNNHAIPKSFYMSDWQAHNLDIIGSFLAMMIVLGWLTLFCFRMAFKKIRKCVDKNEKK